MSDLRPKGYGIMVNGIERNFLFTLNAIDAVQSEFNKNVLEVIDHAVNGKDVEQVKTIRKLVEILLNDEAEREEFLHPGTKLETFTEKQAGWVVDAYLEEIKLAIMIAYGLSMPEPEEDPNQMSGQRNN